MNTSCKGKYNPSTVFRKKQVFNMSDTNIMQSAVASAQNASDLLPILNHLPIDKIKQFVDQCIDEMTPSTVTKLKYNSLPIHQIIPTAVIQYILSFQPIDDGNSRSVSKQWKALSETNEKVHYLQLIQTIDENSPISYNKTTNQTWILHPKRTRLTRIEKQFGFKGPKNTLDMKSDSFYGQPNDRYLLHPDCYDCSDSIGEQCSIIGICPKVRIRTNGGRLGIYNKKNKYMMPSMARNDIVYMQNITFRDELQVCFGSKLCLNNCRILSYEGLVGTGVYVDRGAMLESVNCEYRFLSPAIKISRDADAVTVKDSKFGICGGELWGHYRPHTSKACIEIEEIGGSRHPVYMMWDEVMRDIYRNGDWGEWVKLKCEGNVFENNYGYPIAERGGKTYVEKVELYELRNNILKGENAKRSMNKDDLTDANRIYHGEHIFKVSNRESFK